MKSSPARFILAAAFLLGAGLRLAGALSLRAVGFDDGITFLAASGHEGEYHRMIEIGSPPSGEWVKGSDWKRFLRIEEPLCFRRIGADLAEYDVHPPLYFWLLHLFGLLSGLSPRSAALFNLLLFLPTLALLFGLGRRLLGDEAAAALAAFAWALSPAVLMVSWVARMYCLLSLWGVLLLLLIWRWRLPDPAPGWPAFIALSAVAAAGLLTHYHFALLLAGGLAYAAVAFFPISPRRFFSPAAAILAGSALFAVLHPRFYLSFLIQRSQAVATRLLSPTPRWERELSGIMSFFVGNQQAQKAVLAFLVILSLCAALRRRGGGGSRTGTAFILFFSAWLFLAFSALYLLRLSSWQQMGSRYLSLLYLLLAFLPVLILRALPAIRLPSAAVLCLAFALSGGVRTYRFCAAERIGADRTRFREECRSAVIDNLDRVFLPRAIWSIPDSTPVLAAYQAALLSRPGLLSGIRPPGLYLSRVHWPREREGRDRILEVWERDFRTRLLPGAAVSPGEAYAVEAR